MRIDYNDKVKKQAAALRKTLTDAERVALAYAIVDEPPEWLDSYNAAIRVQAVINKHTGETLTLRAALMKTLQLLERGS